MQHMLRCYHWAHLFTVGVHSAHLDLWHLFRFLCENKNLSLVNCSGNVAYRISVLHAYEVDAQVGFSTCGLAHSQLSNVSVSSQEIQVGELQERCAQLTRGIGCHS